MMVKQVAILQTYLPAAATRITEAAAGTCIFLLINE